MTGHKGQFLFIEPTTTFAVEAAMKGFSAITKKAKPFEKPNLSKASKLEIQDTRSPVLENKTKVNQSCCRLIDRN